MINRNILIWWPKNNEIPVLNMIVRIIKLCLVRTTRGNLFLNFETNQDIFQYMGVPVLPPGTQTQTSCTYQHTPQTQRQKENRLKER